VPLMLLSILHLYTRISSISTLLVYCIHSPLSEGRIGERIVRGFQEWQPPIRTVPYPYSSTHSRHKAFRHIPESMCNRAQARAFRPSQARTSLIGISSHSLATYMVQPAMALTRNLAIHLNAQVEH